MKKLPTFTVRQWIKKDTCDGLPKAIKFYSQIFDMDAPITLVDIINCNPYRKIKGVPTVYSDVMRVPDSCGGGICLNILTASQIKYWEEILNSYMDSIEIRKYMFALVDLITIFLIENGYDVSANRG